MDIYQIIIKPLITEKGTHLTEKHYSGRGGTYCFQVHPEAKKFEIKEAVEKIYNVRVLKVRTANREGKRRRFRLTFGKTPRWKKAYVQLHPDYHIDLF